jgi:hypothetical protein
MMLFVKHTLSTCIYDSLHSTTRERERAQQASSSSIPRKNRPEQELLNNKFEKLFSQRSGVGII